MNVSPQLEDGYVRIANDLVEHLAKLHLSGNEWMIVWTVLRKTWGWNKKEDAISLTQFQEATGLSRPSVQEALNKLVLKKVLVLNKKTYINTYSFNKLQTEWVLDEIVPKRVLVPKKSQLVPKKEPKLVPKKEHTKDNKDTIQKTYSPQVGIVVYFSTEFNKKFGKPYMPVSTDYINAAALLKVHETENLKTYIRWYLNWESWQTKSGYSLGKFYRYINDVVSAASPYKY